MLRPNPLLLATKTGYEEWMSPQNRRWAFQNFHTICRYGFSMRSPDVLILRRDLIPEIEHQKIVQDLTNHSGFSALVVVRNQSILYEAYSNDFSRNKLHTIMSISKTMMHLMVGKCIDEALIDPTRIVREYLPEIGSGYADATIQEVLDMNVINDYTEDYADPSSTALLQNTSMGWRLPTAGEIEIGTRQFLVDICSSNITNTKKVVQYKSANTDVLGWIVEKTTKKALREHYLDIVEASGFEHLLYMSTDRLGVPNSSGGVCLTALDLARYGLIFTKHMRGVHGERIGSAALLEATRQCSGPNYPDPNSHIYYCNQLITNGRWVGHGGWGGQFFLVHPESKTVVVYFSVLENDSASDDNHRRSVIEMAETITNIS